MNWAPTANMCGTRANSRISSRSNDWRRVPLGSTTSAAIGSMSSACHSSTRWGRPRQTGHASVDTARRDLISLAEAMGLGLTAFVIIVLMTRSMIKGLRGNPVTVTIAGEGPDGAADRRIGMGALALAGSEQGHGSPQGDQAALTDELTVTLNEIEGQIERFDPSVGRPDGARPPDTTLAIIRGWMAG